MAEAVGLGASVITFVGLAGSILQGCISVRTFLDDFKDASSDIQALKSELAIFQTSLDSFRMLLISGGHADQDAYLALEHCEKAVSTLQMSVQNLGKSNRKWIGHFRSVTRKDSIMKHVNALGRARSSIIACQLNLAISLGQRHAQESRDATTTLTTLLDRTSVSSSSAANLKAKDLDTQLVSQTETEERPHRLQNAIKRASRSYSPSRVSYEVVSQETFPIEQNIEYGDASDLPSVIVSMAKDTIRGVLVEYYLQQTTSGRMQVEYHTSTNFHSKRSSTLSQLQLSQLSRSRRRIIQRATEHHMYERTLGVVTVTTTTIQFEGMTGDNDDDPSDVTTSTTIRLDPNPLFLRVRLFSAVPQSYYQAGFDPVLRVSNRIRHDSPIVTACRSGDLHGVRLLFADRSASPFDRTESAGELSLLQIIFREIILQIDQPHSRSMLGLCQTFKFLVDQGLDPGQLGKQHRPLMWVPSNPTRTYILTCSFCLTAIHGDYYDCNICAGGDYTLCANCLDTGRHCLSLQHHIDQPLKNTNQDRRVMLVNSPIVSLASLHASRVFEPHLVDLARVIIHRSIEDPFRDSQLDEMIWYRNVAGIESPVCPLILKQDEWFLSPGVGTTARRPSLSPPINIRNYLLRDPKGTAFRAWLASAPSSEEGTTWKILAWILGQSYLPEDEKEYRELIINHLTASIEVDNKSLYRYILPTLVPLLKKTSRLSWLQEALHRCVNSLEDFKLIKLDVWLEAQVFNEQSTRWSAVAQHLLKTDLTTCEEECKEKIVSHIALLADIATKSMERHILPTLAPTLIQKGKTSWLKEALQRSQAFRDRADDLMEQNLYVSMVYQLAFLEAKDFFQPGEIRYQEIDMGEWGYAKYYLYIRDGIGNEASHKRPFPKYVHTRWDRQWQGR